MPLSPKTARIAIVSGCVSPIHTSLSRLMPSQMQSWQQRWTVRTAVSKTAFSRASLHLKEPVAFHGLIRETARTYSRCTGAFPGLSMRTNLKPVSPISRRPSHGRRTTSSRIAWSFVAVAPFALPRSSEHVSDTDSPNLTRTFAPFLGHFAPLPIWREPWISRPKSRIVQSPAARTTPPPCKNLPSGTCPYFGAARTPAFFRPSDEATTRTGSIKVRVLGSGFSAATAEIAEKANAKRANIFCMLRASFM